jgi:hypothetical protein
MKKIVYSLIAILIISATYYSCGKYEDGPAISLRSKTARITGVWEITEVKIDGTSVFDDFKQDSLYCNFVIWEDPIEMRVGQITDCTNNPDKIYGLTWNWGEGQKICIYPEYYLPPNNYGPIGSLDIYCWEILLLKNKKMKWKTTYNGQEYQMWFNKLENL